MCAERCHWTVNQCPTTSDSTGKKSGILVIGRENYSESFESFEIFSEGEGDTGAATRIRGIDDRVLF